ncbi:MAG TPA: DMT family transporter, partial [Gaiellales bacterium]|nr:DMT family transporter [Gaiellales bacterium]
MVYPIGVLAALMVGLGYVLQQRVAATMPLSEVLHWRLLYDLMHRPLWWGGIGAMVVGQVLSGYAFQLASVGLVEPLTSTSLLFALVFSSLLSRIKIKWTEIAGAALLSAALGMFIFVGNPHSTSNRHAPNLPIVIAMLCVLATVGILIRVARRKTLVIESVLLSCGAGVLYGLQDASTRGALVSFDHGGIVHMFLNAWIYMLLAAAVIGILLAQSAFKAARLDYSLPPITAVEPVVGILLGVTLLGDKLTVSPLGLSLECVCLVAMLAGVLLIARSANLAAGGAPVTPAHAS